MPGFIGLPPGHRTAPGTGHVMLAFPLTPLGDAIVILSHSGSATAAYGIHVATAALVAATGFAVLRTNAHPPALPPIQAS
ncbi:DUF4267 domain-containing protein [Streptomyces halobius]|uniref:Uncharacterized protein n=1 Tax=Streptomyces halobius TaxID=2879846 RepID=A0ABY4MDE4_9ACTN|nr:DUF4267 domain-containing protein [Streptomyces halobius]UQA94769.1 hypothetical protein K9S39_25520 [Streptomyces halobius]